MYESIFGAIKNMKKSKRPLKFRNIELEKYIADINTKNKEQKTEDAEFEIVKPKQIEEKLKSKP